MSTYGRTREIKPYNANYQLPPGGFRAAGAVALTGDLTVTGTTTVNALSLPGNQTLLKSVTTTIDMSAGGTAQTAAVTTVPAGSFLLGVVAVVGTAADGDATQTLEVGVTGNIDAYIDTLNFNPGAAAGTQACSIGGANNDVKTYQYLAAATPIIATWTNTANATAGAVDVTVIYL
jgi:hypothetical protein